MVFLSASLTFFLENGITMLCKNHREEALFFRKEDTL